MAGEPTSKSKPYTTGAIPITTASKANVHMSGGGWVRTITTAAGASRAEKEAAYAWAGNDDVNSDPEVLVAFRGSGSIQGFFTYLYWYVTPSAGTPVALTLHMHFSESITVTGTPTVTVTNDQLGSGGGGTAATIVCSFTSLHANKHRAYFVSAVPSANQLKQGAVLRLAANSISLAGGTIKDEGTNTNTLITHASDVGYNGRPNTNGNQSATSTGTTPVAETDGPRIIVAA